MKFIRIAAVAAVLMSLTGITAAFAQDAPPPPPVEQPTPPQPPPAPPEPQPPAPPPAQQLTDIYVIVAGQQRGPLNLDQVIAEIRAGTITRDTLVWTPDQPGWVAAGQHPVIGQQFTAVAPPAPPAPPPPPPPPPAAQFFFEQGGQSVGPLSIAQITEEIRKGTVKRQTLVWKSGSSGWVAAVDIPELKSILNSMPPELPPGGELKRFMVGTWEYTAPAVQGMTTTTTIQYREDGTYSGVATVSMGGVGSASQAVSGKWSVQPITGDRFSLTLTADGGFGATTVELRKLNDNVLENVTQGGQARRVG